jgi:CheY-like chemotaxis protein
VEDSAPNRLVAKSILSKGGYSVEAVENGLQAVSAVAEKSYGLVLMDVAMPEMDGLEATRAIRALPGEAARVPIVAMTAGAFSEDKQQCLDAGMDDHLSKPIVRAELMRAVERWLKRREASMG